jgi:hypothetical protein
MTPAAASKPRTRRRAGQARSQPPRERHPVPAPASTDEPATLPPWVDVAQRSREERSDGVVDDWATVEATPAEQAAADETDAASG